MMRKGTRIVLLMWLVLIAAVQVRAAESGPQAVLRRFCQSDGLGQRVLMPGWMVVAPLVTWSLEPAWDHVILIGSYEVGSPHMDEDGASIEVRYTVIGEVSALGLDTTVHVETVEFTLEAPDDHWRIAGPPLPPHIFAHRVDLDALRQSLTSGGLNVIPNSTFVWQLFRSAGWEVPLVGSLDLLTSSAYRLVPQPRVGDLAVYLRDGVPYHVGVFETDDRIVSSTLNAGIVRTAPDAFAGELKYLRLVEPEPPPEVPETDPDSSATATPTPRSVAALTPERAATRTAPGPRRSAPAPAVRHVTAPPKAPAPAQPSQPQRVEHVRKRKVP